MARQKIVKEVTKIFCDVCEVEITDKNTGDWYSTTMCNGEVYEEFYCPIDLCKVCMPMYSRIIAKKGVSNLTAQERYDSFRGDKENLIKELKELNNDSQQNS
ncbi:MAG: hypothetical protein [Bacteriophage sp.]|nr:MAG: hypothetical protein [Bacteriophage sp.]